MTSLPEEEKKCILSRNVSFRLPRIRRRFFIQTNQNVLTIIYARRHGDDNANNMFLCVESISR